MLDTILFLLAAAELTMPSYVGPEQLQPYTYGEGPTVLRGNNGL